MKKRFGLFSLFLMILAFLIASAAICRLNPLISLVYLIFSVALCGFILFVYCKKCTCKENCAHVIPGFFARFIKADRSGSYTRTDLVITFSCMGIILLTPQYWLIKRTLAFVCYWILTGTSFFLIVKEVCVSCCNFNCPLNRS
jgi:hypothetical protein